MALWFKQVKIVQRRKTSSNIVTKSKILNYKKDYVFEYLSVTVTRTKRAHRIIITQVLFSRFSIYFRKNLIPCLLIFTGVSINTCYRFISKALPLASFLMAVELLWFELFQLLCVSCIKCFITFPVVSMTEMWYHIIQISKYHII